MSRRVRSCAGEILAPSRDFRSRGMFHLGHNSGGPHRLSRLLRVPVFLSPHPGDTVSTRMAVYTGDRGQARGGGHRSQRENTRGSVRGRGRGRARSSRGGTKNVFHSSRLKEEPADLSDIDGVEPQSIGSEDLEAEKSSDSDGDLGAETTQPYSTLLQSLKGELEDHAPPRKRRKTELNDVPREEQRSLEFSQDNPDEVEEVEESNDLGTEDVDNNEEEQGHDPFIEHFDPSTEVVDRGIEFIKQNTWFMARHTIPHGWSYLLKIPQASDAAPGPSSTFPSDTEALILKQKLKKPAKKQMPTFDKHTAQIASSMFRYRDILFPHRTLENCETLRRLTSLHVLNHIFKTRDRIIKHNARLTKEALGEDLELRDQGFTRPKVLIILPTRNSCVKYVETMISLSEPEQQENKKRFQDSYDVGEQVSADKPVDFQELFNGNDDDMFRLGLKLTRKTIKFFAQFYNSDIILASPLGLRMALGADDPKKQDSDFLSSIEIVVMDQADSILMQNWEHIEYIFDRLNLQPKEAHGCDFSRVRNWYLDGNARYLRQTILLSAFNYPSINRIYTQHMLNVAGKVKYSEEMDGAMTALDILVKQTFSRFESGMPIAEPDNRFKYFVTAVIPSLTKPSRHSASAGQGVLIYLPSYADFVRVRNFLATSSATQDISFGSISEYTSVKDVTRARSHFLSGRHSVLLYTERAHHFRRYHLKGTKRIIMYGLPENPIFYKEIVGGFLGASIAAAKLSIKEVSIRALFSKLDALKLERIVGTKRYLSMLKEKGGDTFDFV